MSSVLSAEEHAKLANTMAGWGADAGTIAAILEHGVFGPGSIAMRPDDPELGTGVGLIVDEDRDPELATLFDRRRRILDDQAFFADWTVAPVQVGTVLSPHAPEALLAYSIGLERPWPLRRTFLLLVSRQAHIIGLLQEPGTSVWLVPKQAAVPETTRQQPGTANDLWSESLPLGVMNGPNGQIRLALQHVSSTS